MSRKISREFAVAMVNSYCFNNDKELGQTLFENAKNDFFSVKEPVLEADKEFCFKLYEGVTLEFENLTADIKTSVKDFSFSQIFKLDLSILLVAYYEIKSNLTPAAVAINEAVEIAKKYSTAKSPAFVNAVLSALMKKIK